jgi:hypothetical protein
MSELPAVLTELGDGPFDGAVVASGETARGEVVPLRRFHEEEPIVDSDSEYDRWGETCWPRAHRRGRAPACGRGSGEVVGVVSWHSAHYGPNAGSLAWNMGAGWRRTPSAEASAPWRSGCSPSTCSPPPASRWRPAPTCQHREQRALERAGFTREGVLRAQTRRTGGTTCRHSVLRGEV